MNEADEKSMVLLDEVGSGTDPEVKEEEKNNSLIS